MTHRRSANSVAAGIHNAAAMPVPPTDPTLLRLEGGVVRRGERPLFAPVDLALAPGDVVWLRGANGQGKTTLLRTLAGLATLASGTLVRSTALAFLGHGNALKDELTAIEALAFLASLGSSGVTAAALAAALDRLGLPPRHRQAPVRTLSQGQRRRVALARLALPQPPPLWLLDEPFDALDADGTQRVAGLVAAHVAAGGGVLLTSHLPVEVAGRELRSVELRPSVRAAST
jgi:heme exporter protein A